MLINGAGFPHKAQHPMEGREIMHAEFTGAVGSCCKEGGHLWSQNDSCIEMRRLSGGYFSRVGNKEWTPVIWWMRGGVTRQEWVVFFFLSELRKQHI